jgi:hypothetical protein
MIAQPVFFRHAAALPPMTDETRELLIFCALVIGLAIAIAIPLIRFARRERARMEEPKESQPETNFLPANRTPSTPVFEQVEAEVNHCAPEQWTGAMRPDWTALKHAYGVASDVPPLLAALSGDPNSEVWHELWSRLCHQGTVYSASFAALPELARAALAWNAPDRLMPLGLAAAIIGSDDVSGDRSAFAQGLDPVVEDLHRLTLADIANPAWSDSDFVDLLQSLMLLERNLPWGSCLDCLLGGEFPGLCTSCETDLYVAVGEYGFFVTAEEWVSRPQTPRNLICPASPSSLHGDEERLYLYAQRSGHARIASWFLHAFGESTCPACQERLSMVKVIVAAV